MRDSTTKPTSRVAIIGGGASGTIALLQLLEACGPLTIDIFDPCDVLGGGIAYGEPHFLLNVEASRLGYDPRNPADFLSWLSLAHPRVLSSAHFPFVERSLYRDYLHARLLRHSRSRWRHVRSQVLRAERTQDRWRLETETGSSILYQHVFLCTGYERNLSGDVLNIDVKSPLIFQPDVRSLSRICTDSDVVIIGSGLTAFDAWSFLRSRGHVGRITMLSRRALQPLPHDQDAKSLSLPEFKGLSPRRLLRALRAYKNASEVSWPNIADGVRKQSEFIWAGWSARDRVQFLSHLLPYWQSIRHRLPQAARSAWLSDAEKGQALLAKGRIERTQVDSEKLRLVLTDGRQISAGAVVLASGRSISRQVFGLGIEPCQYGFGFENKSASNLWLIGPASKSKFWEVTAIGDIRKQIAEVIASPQFIEPGPGLRPEPFELTAAGSVGVEEAESTMTVPATPS